MQAKVERRAWLSLLASALLFKAIYLAQYIELPFLYGPLFDSPVYLHQATAVRAGRFGDPALVAFSPLYGYFLAAVDYPGWHGSVVVVQLLLGLLNLALIRLITKRWFGEVAGLVSAALYLSYGLLVFYETKLMSETVGITLLLAALSLLTSARFMRGDRPTGLTAGVLLGLATLARASLLPTLPWFAVVPLRKWGAADPMAQAGLRPRARRSSYIALGILFVLGMHGAWTKYHTGLFIPVIMVSNATVQSMRSGDAKDDLMGFGSDKFRVVSAWSLVEQARTKIAHGQRGGAELQQSRGKNANIDFVALLRGAPRKIWLTLRNVETTFDYGYYGERSELGALRWAPVSFGLLLSLASLGLLLVWRNGQCEVIWPLAPIVIGVFCTTTLFHPSSRYRLPLVLALLPLAAAALHLAPRLQPLRVRVAAVLCGGLAIAYFSIVSVTNQVHHPAAWELRVAEAAAISGAPGEARRRMRRAHELAPNDRNVQRRVLYLEEILSRRTVSHSR